MKYPKVPNELNRRQKLFEEDLDRARELRKLGLTYKEIGIALEVHSTTIYYHLNPRQAEAVKQRVRESQRYRWRNDPEYRNKKLKSGAESKSYLRKVNPEAREYKRQNDAEYRKRKKLLTPTP
jgi:hypothetical protein